MFMNQMVLLSCHCIYEPFGVTVAVASQLVFQICGVESVQTDCAISDLWC